MPLKLCELMSMRLTTVFVVALLAVFVSASSFSARQVRLPSCVVLIVVNIWTHLLDRLRGTGAHMYHRSFPTLMTVASFATKLPSGMSCVCVSLCVCVCVWCISYCVSVCM